MSENKNQFKEYLEARVNPILKPLMKELVTTKPNNVIFFIERFCREKGRDIEQAILTSMGEEYDRSHLPDSDDSFVDPEDIVDDLPMEIIKKKQKKKKTAISAEAYGEYNKLGEFKPRVIEKNEEQKQQIHSVLQKNFMFNNLEKQNQDIIVMAMEKRDYKAGDQVIKQGDDGEELFIVFSGKLKCTKTTEAEEIYLRSYESGEVFGELALMYNAPRAANILAEQDAILFALDRDTFNNIVKNATIKKREQYVQFLNKIDILSTLNTYEKDKLCDCLSSQTFKKDEFIIKEGEVADRFYLIQEGKAEAYKNKNGKAEKVFDYKENEYFGELALLDGDKRQASIKVTSDTMIVVYLDKKSFKRLLGSIEDLLKRNKEKYSKYVSSN